MESRDIDWFVPLCVIAAIELLLSGIFAVRQLFPTYMLLAGAAALLFAFGTAVWLVVGLFRHGEEQPIGRLIEMARDGRSRMAYLLLGLIVATVSACAVTALKSGITNLVPFYADPFLAKVDRAIFGEDAWRWTNAVFGWAFLPLSLLYATWLFGQVATTTAVLFSRPSQRKSQALIAHVLMWFVLGIVLAYALSSAGPVFYDQVYGGMEFRGLGGMLARSTLTAGADQYLWHVHQANTVQFAAGISAMPSMHVAGATWLALVLSAACPRLRPACYLYVGMIYLGSMMTGWHYSLDGIVGCSGALLMWKAAGMVARWRGILPVSERAQSGVAQPEIVNI